VSGGIPVDGEVTVTAAAPEGCPPATQDVALNLENRKNAIDTALYGPLNPAEPNDEYWGELAGEWGVDVETARQQRCGNCAVFVVTPSMKECISFGLTGETGSDDFDSIDEAGELGYCEAFDFKCAAARTCRAWVAGGPVTAAGERRKVAQTPAPKKDRISGSKRNPEGSASGGGRIDFDAATEKALKNKVADHNEGAAEGRRVTLTMLKAVYRRGAGAYSTSHRPGKTRSQWAMARVNAFLKLVSSGSPTNKAYTTDNDLLPASHPRSTRSSASVDHERELAEVDEFALTELGSPWGDDVRESVYDSLGNAAVPTVSPVLAGGRGEAVVLAEAPTTVSFGARTEEELGRMVRTHNSKAPVGRGVSLSVVKAVYRRGGASFHPSELATSGTTRSEWAQRRVDAFLSLMLSDRPTDPSYTQDNDLLPPSHPLSTADPVTASGFSLEGRAATELGVSLAREESEYASDEDAILAITEALGRGYEAEFAVRASWVRGVRADEDPYRRACELVNVGSAARDADLLPNYDSEVSR
jgi:hypothetical protein